MMMVLNTFPPLQAAIARAASLRTEVNAFQDELRSPHPRDAIVKAEHTIGKCVQLGELLPLTWREVFHGLFGPDSASWQSVREFEAVGQLVSTLFHTVRLLMAEVREGAAELLAVTPRQLAGMDRLLKVIEAVRQLEEKVFRDWPSFVDPWLPTESISLEESLAEALGVTVDEARQKLDRRRQ